MENEKYCQSCSMPLDKPELLGTEKDGSKSHEYCLYCYQNGSFTSPNLTLDKMKIIIRDQMEKRHIDQTLISMALTNVPYLKRWKRNLSV